MLMGRNKSYGRCNQMTSFGWSSRCFGTGRLSIVLLGLLVLACSYGASVASFELRELVEPGGRISVYQPGGADGFMSSVMLMPVAGMHSHG